MHRLSIVIIVLIAATLACTLSSDPDDSGSTPARTIEALPTNTPFVTSPPTSTPLATTAPVATATPIVIGDPCTPRTSWPVYQVVAGDTLASIARRTGSTANALAEANCLDNPNLLSVGQALHVPQLPPPPTHTPVPTDPPAANAPVFRYPPTPEAYYLYIDSHIVITQDVRLTAGVDHASYVQFYVYRPDSDSTMMIGTDHTPTGTAAITFRFPAPGRYGFFAVAGNAQGEVTSATFPVVYNPDFEEPLPRQGQPVVEPHLAFDGHYTLEAGSTVKLGWTDIPPDAVRVDFYLTPTGTGTADAAQVIATDTNPADTQPARWDVPGGLWAHLHAEATLPDGSKVSSGIVNVYAE